MLVAASGRRVCGFLCVSKLLHILYIYSKINTYMLYIHTYIRTYAYITLGIIRVFSLPRYCTRYHNLLLLYQNLRSWTPSQSDDWLAASSCCACRMWCPGIWSSLHRSSSIPLPVRKHAGDCLRWLARPLSYSWHLSSATWCWRYGLGLLSPLQSPLLILRYHQHTPEIVCCHSIYVFHILVHPLVDLLDNRFLKLFS